ncbi:MAG: acyl-CoA thioesterase [Deltaproteobacteria bacterium]|nr:acyl-CoA thioesterase [Deltaproteobacteria bacterium]
MPPFRYVQTVRFGDIDHAGIVFYPRFFNYCHIAFEELFGQGEYCRVLDERRIGFPAVHVECDFQRPLRFGDRVAVDVQLVRMGGRSLTLRYVLSKEGDPSGATCAEAKITCAIVNLDTFQSVPLPEGLRRLFEALKP